MKNKPMTIFLILAAIYAVFLLDFSLSVTKSNHKYSLQWNGVVWVALDHYSIWKYESGDKPMKIISLKAKKIK